MSHRTQWLYVLSWLLGAWWLAWPMAALSQPQAMDEPAQLRWLQRDIATLRAPLAGATPQERVDRALERIRALPVAAMDDPLQVLPFALGSQTGVQFLLGDHLLFSLLQDDLDPELRQADLQAQADLVRARLEQARRAWHEQRDLQVWWLALAKLIGGTALAWLLVRWVSGGSRRLGLWLERRRRHRASKTGRVDWRELLDRLASRLTGLAHGLLLLLIGFVWVEWVLAAFPLTQPVAERWYHWLVEQLTWVLHGIGQGLPGLLTVLIVMLVTRAVADLFSYFFDAVQAGRVQLPFLHPETTSATRRIVAALVWVLGIGIAYPYLPGAGTQAFQGLSVMVGLMVTLGATGIVTQAMSGLLLIYARALRRGDFVSVGQVEGVVTEVGPLATKVLNLRNEEITVPNAVLIASPIHNFSKLADTQGTLVSTQVTIGYDAPWRQVHDLLIGAARATPHFRQEPGPRVFQRALSDFYVEYELIVSMDRPIERVAALSALHANIQDAFNRAGVQIMSPHYLGDPPQPVVVPPERWHTGTSGPT